MPNSLTVSEGRLFFSAGGELWAICLKDTPPAADFVAWPTDGPGPLQVGFENYSTCEFSTCSWDFGDGSTATGCADQKHTYIRTGTYSVKLTITGPGGTNSMILRNQITVFEAVAADFSAAPTRGPAPLEVTFKNQSSGDYNVCGWDFGDGTTATECADQTHTYAGTGKYTVKLSAKGPGGGDTMTKEQYILVETYRTFLPGVLGR
jgi:PKD repeat protein